MITVVAAILLYSLFVMYVRNRRRQQMQAQEIVIQRHRRQMRHQNHDF